MEKKRRLQNRTVGIRVEPYLSEYAIRKFELDEKTHGIKIPDNYDLYICIWNRMERRPAGVTDTPGANLRIFLPCRRSGADGMPRKHPEYWNWLSPAAALEIEAQLRLLFNFDFHTRMMDNEAQGRPRQQREVVEDFIRDYRLESISSDALLKNFQRYRQRLSPRKKRKYQKNATI